MSTDPFRDVADVAYASARGPFPVNPHDTDELAVIPKALYIGTGGTVTLRGMSGTVNVVFRNVASGQVLDIRRASSATGTTAIDIVALA